MARGQVTTPNERPTFATGQTFLASTRRRANRGWMRPGRPLRWAYGSAREGHSQTTRFFGVYRSGIRTAFPKVLSPSRMSFPPASV